MVRPATVASLLMLSLACGESPVAPDPDPEPDPQPPVGAVAAEIVLTPEALALTPWGETAVVTATVLDDAGAELPDAPVSWSTSNAAVATVDDQGTVTAVDVGTASITARSGDAEGTAAATTAYEAITGGVVACTNGRAAGFPCSGVDLVSFLPLADLGAPNGVKLNDMWGWTDAATSREFVLVGRTDGLTFVEVTDALNPRALGHLPAAAAPASWRDVKVYADHAYVVADGSPGHGVQIFDLTRLRDVDEFTLFDEDGRYTEVSSVHNIAVNEESGFAYAVGSSGGGMSCGGGLHMIDLSSPLAPTFAGCFADTTTGNSMTGYTHDVQCVMYDGPDADYAGREICIGSNETAISIADVTDKRNPVALGMATYPNVAYSHQGWITDDHAYFFMNDELDEGRGLVEGTRTLIWDIQDLEDPILVKEYVSDNPATDHNLYIRGDLMYQSNYNSGLRILDVSDPENPTEVAYFDTVPYAEGPSMGGSWS
ncbi:MAG TPA: choice-of-anchor B family protein, partial [Gemmatimonadota bacterium]|nr:choice-of-anchor B family protein [Gemmatimonadota bacterium]